MVTKTAQVEEKVESQQWQLAPLSERVEAIRDSALDRARTKLPIWQQDAELAELLLRRGYPEYLKQAMAHDLAELIAEHDQHIESIYIFDESANSDSETEDFPSTKDLTIHLLVLVETPSAALDAFIASLDRVLTESLHELPAKAFAARTSFLDVIPITQSDVKSGRGYAALLNSLYAPPFKLWERE